MHALTQPAPISKPHFWTGRILSGLPALFMLFDATIHIVRPAPVVEAFKQLDYPISASVGIGIIQLISLALYLIPRTAVLGAVLLTGVLGGAIATQVRIGAPPFESYIFATMVGLLLWGGLWLRDARLRQVFPIREG
jgi:DoxX-like family